MPKGFAIKYEDLFYTTEPPCWGPTFTPHKEKAYIFPSEKEARQKADDLTTFTLNIIQM